MNAQQIAGFTAIGATFADSEVTADEDVLSFTKLVCPEGATLPIYDLWETGSKYWKAGYAEGKKIPLTDADGKENNTVTKAFSRFTTRVEKAYGITKPAKPTGSGPAKANQRAKQAEELAKRMQFQHAEAPSMVAPEAELAEEGDVVSVAEPVRNEPKVGRNEACPCGSGKKYKHCHGQIS